MEEVMAVAPAAVEGKFLTSLLCGCVDLSCVCRSVNKMKYSIRFVVCPMSISQICNISITVIEVK